MDAVPVNSILHIGAVDQVITQSAHHLRAIIVAGYELLEHIVWKVTRGDSAQINQHEKLPNIQNEFATSCGDCSAILIFLFGLRLLIVCFLGHFKLGQELV